MGDYSIALSIIVARGVNVGNFIDWYNRNIFVDTNGYQFYLEDFKDKDLGKQLLNEFEYSFITNWLMWNNRIG